MESTSPFFYQVRYFGNFLGGICLIVVTAFAVWFAHVGEIFLRQTFGEPRHHSFARGTSLQTAVSLLSSESLERDLDQRLAVRVQAYPFTFDQRIKSGEYFFKPCYSIFQSLEQMALGPNHVFRLTIKAGETYKLITERLTDLDVMSEESVKQTESWLIKSVTGSISTIEGLFAPDTHFLNSESDGLVKLFETAVRARLKELREIFGQDSLDQNTSNGLTVYESVILASIVEKEVADVTEMATVTSVFMNRLKKGWPLGSAATLRFIHDDFEGHDHQLPIDADSPYNTMKRKGLPPGPICIPSKAALLAVKQPPRTDYMFFMADGEGGTIFTRTLKEHNRVKYQYRKALKKP